MNKYALDIIKEFEGCELASYADVGGVWTIGYGRTKGVLPNQTITQEQAEAFLAKDLTIFEAGVYALVGIPLTERQIGALISFSYNVGLHALASSTLLRKINSCQLDNLTSEFLRWNKVSGKVIKGLTRRRQAEADLFYSG